MAGNSLETPDEPGIQKAKDMSFAAAASNNTQGHDRGLSFADAERALAQLPPKDREEVESLHVRFHPDYSPPEDQS